eukprot:gene5939-biopygen12217
MARCSTVRCSTTQHNLAEIRGAPRSIFAELRSRAPRRSISESAPRSAAERRRSAPRSTAALRESRGGDPRSSAAEFRGAAFVNVLSGAPRRYAELREVMLSS